MNIGKIGEMYGALHTNYGQIPAGLLQNAELGHFIEAEVGLLRCSNFKETAGPPRVRSGNHGKMASTSEAFGDFLEPTHGEAKR